jgi:hypothetical protein
MIGKEGTSKEGKDNPLTLWSCEKVEAERFWSTTVLNLQPNTCAELAFHQSGADAPVRASCWKEPIFSQLPFFKWEYGRHSGQYLGMTSMQMMKMSSVRMAPVFMKSRN